MQIHSVKLVVCALSAADLCVYVFVSDLLALRTEEEWREVRQRINDLPQDEALTAEFSKVLPTMLWFALPDLIFFCLSTTLDLC